MTDTPEAVRLADQIHAGNGEWMQKAAALLRRIPGLEAEVQEQARLNGMGAERELALMAQVSRLEAERDQLRAELEKVRWQPIETAPKDGTNVLLINRALNQAAGLWMNSISGVGWYLRGGIRPDVFFNSHYGPTHWMPLPAAPTPPNADQKGQ